MLSSYIIITKIIFPQDHLFGLISNGNANSASSEAFKIFYLISESSKFRPLLVMKFFKLHPCPCFYICPASMCAPQEEAFLKLKSPGLSVVLSHVER